MILFVEKKKGPLHFASAQRIKQLYFGRIPHMLDTEMWVLSIPDRDVAPITVPLNVDRRLVTEDESLENLSSSNFSAKILPPLDSV